MKPYFPCTTSILIRPFVSRLSHPLLRFAVVIISLAPLRSATETSSRIHKFPARIRGTLHRRIPEIFLPKISQKFVVDFRFVDTFQHPLPAFLFVLLLLRTCVSSLYLPFVGWKLKIRNSPLFSFSRVYSVVAVCIYSACASAWKGVAGKFEKIGDGMCGVAGIFADM